MLTWLMLVFYSLGLSGGSFPKPLTEQEEQHYLALARQGDLEARNILIERNLRLVAHIMKKYYAQASDQDDLISITAFLKSGQGTQIRKIREFLHMTGTQYAHYLGDKPSLLHKWEQEIRVVSRQSWEKCFKVKP